MTITSTTRIRSAAAAAALVVLTAGLAGCAGEEEPAAEPVASTVETPVATEEPAEAVELAADGSYVSFNDIDVVLTTMTLQGVELRELSTACMPQFVQEYTHDYDPSTGAVTLNYADTSEKQLAASDDGGISLYGDGADDRRGFAAADSAEGEELVAAYEQMCLDSYGEFENDGRS
ncbi:hypothetical protein [Leucobacter massiliensis]|nr:hypothetical protein [Leucobacter massiliensis]